MTGGRRVLRSVLRNPTLLAGGLTVLIIVLLAVLAPVLAPYDPVAISLRDKLQAPSARHLFGTDEMGRDILSRVMYGARISLKVGLLVVGIAGGIGVTLGALAGYMGGNVENVVMRLTDIFLAFPSLVLALAIAAALGPGITNAMIAVTSSWWPWYCRLMRGLVLPLKQQQFVEAAVSSGAGGGRVMLRHILPNCVAPLIVQATMDVGYVVLTTASLSFIGLGAQPPTPEWGAMVAAGRRFLLDQWWCVTFPGLAIFAAVLGFSLLGDGLRDLADPLTRLKR